MKLCLSLLCLFAALPVGAQQYSQLKDGTELAAGKVVTITEGFVAAYLLDDGDGGYVLIDAGNEKGTQRLDAALAKRRDKRAAVRAVFLTHAHVDHTALLRSLPGAEVWVLPADKKLLSLDRAKELKDGQVVRVGKLDVEVFAVPGHTAGSAAFLAHGVLFLGDNALATEDGDLAPAPHRYNEDSDQNLASLQALARSLSGRAAEVRALAFAHSAGLEPGALFRFAKTAETTQTKWRGRKMTMKLADVRLRDVFTAVSDLSGKTFLLALSVEKKITVDVKDEPWDKLASDLAANNGLKLVEQNSLVFVIPTKAELTPSKPFTGKRITINVVDGALGDILELVAAHSGVKVQASKDAYDTRVTFHIRNAPWDQVIYMIEQLHGLEHDDSEPIVLKTSKTRKPL